MAKVARRTAQVTIPAGSGEITVVLAPLNLAELQQVRENSKKFTSDGDADWIKFVNETAPLIEASMERATGKHIDSRVMLDLESWRVVWDALLEVSGLKVPSAGEAKPATA
jgi:hypothetical protein